MTRGMLVTTLGRLAGVDIKLYTTNSITDVKTNSTFRPYITCSGQLIFYGLLNRNMEKPYRARTQAHPFFTETEKTPSKESVEKTKKWRACCEH